MTRQTKKLMLACILALAAGSGCGAVGKAPPGSQPDAGKQACTVDADCPAGTFCYYGDVYDPRHRCAQLSSAWGDMTGPPPDMSWPFGWDPNKPKSVVPGCIAGGWALTPTMSACPAAINKGSLVQTCNTGTGWSPCTQNGLSREACDAIPWGFFAGTFGLEPTGFLPPTIQFQCYWQGAHMPYQRAIIGCGKAHTGTTYINSLPCAGFDAMVTCNQQTGAVDSAWSCPVSMPLAMDSDYLQVSNTDARDGVLCCHP